MNVRCASGSFFLMILQNVYQIEAFTPICLRQAKTRPTKGITRSLSPIDVHNIQDIPNHIQSIQDAMTTISIADLDPTGVVTDVAVQSAPNSAAGEIATQAAKTTDNGWFGFLTGPTMGFLELIHAGLRSVGMDSNSWGVSIIILTITIKLLTYPLTKSQLESTQKMQALQPTMKDIQAKYQSNPEVMNQKIAELYQTNNVNPLAGCIPSLVQIPVFIGLYRAVLDLANENKLDESFLWLPSLEGPLYGADPTKGSAWLFDGWNNGVPPLGWDNTIAFLILPAVLVASQFLSMELMATPETKDQQPAFLKVLPLMIGWFSLNVPSALCVYWVTNNIVTTASSVIIRNSLKMEPTPSVGSTASSAVASPSSQVFSPPTIREKPEGFASSVSTTTSIRDGVTPITSSSGAIDVDVISKESSTEEQELTPPAVSQKKRGSKKKKKRRN